MFPESLICKYTKPSHKIKVGRSPIFYVQSQTVQNILKSAESRKNPISLDRIITD